MLALRMIKPKTMNHLFVVVAVLLLFVPAASGFQWPIATRRLLTSMAAHRYDPYMTEDGGNLYDDDYTRQKRLRQWNGGVGDAYYSNHYNSAWTSARIPYSSYDAYDTGMFGVRSLAPDHTGDTRDARGTNRYWNYREHPHAFDSGYGHGGNHFDYGYYDDMPMMYKVERTSHAYSAPAPRAVKPDGTLAFQRHAYRNRREEYAAAYDSHDYDRNLYVDEDRWSTNGDMYSPTSPPRDEPRGGPRTPNYNSKYGQNSNRRPEGVPVRGGDEETFTVQQNVRRVRVLLQTEGMPLYATMHLLSGNRYDNVKNLGSIFRDIDEGPFEAIVDTPEADSKIRVINTGSYEYTVYAWLEPFDHEQSRYGDRTFGDSQYEQSTHGNNRTGKRKQFVSPYTSYQSMSRFDEDGRLIVR